MRTVELSEEKARTLAHMLAPKWANMAVRLPAVNVPGNTPYRLFQEPMASRAFKARVAARKRDFAALGAFLEGLGIQLPTADRSAFVGPYKSPTPGSKTVQLWIGHKADKEAERLVALIREQVK